MMKIELDPEIFSVSSRVARDQFHSSVLEKFLKPYNHHHCPHAFGDMIVRAKDLLEGSIGIKVFTTAHDWIDDMTVIYNQHLASREEAPSIKNSAFEDALWHHGAYRFALEACGQDLNTLLVYDGIDFELWVTDGEMTDLKTLAGVTHWHYVAVELISNQPVEDESETDTDWSEDESEEDQAEEDDWELPPLLDQVEPACAG